MGKLSSFYLPLSIVNYSSPTKQMIEFVVWHHPDYKPNLVF
ncbi:hypothetical protein FDUTEX481_09020 [Tolypothrix sp. PCC 7601]|nr:hypothetical protein FDUTEX481_09020 [Tolypothrix sp. PCC 7601]